MRNQPEDRNEMERPCKKAAKKGAKKCAKKAAFKMAVEQARSSKESVRRRLAKVKERDPVLPLPKFVKRVNKIAERYLPPGRPLDGRVTSEFNERTVRHYQGRDIIDAPEKEGREARYCYRHVMQAVLTRVLLADGFRVPMIREMLAGKTDEDYESLLEMGPMQARKLARGMRGEGRRGDCGSVGSREGRQVFVRLEIEPGIEVHIARGVAEPGSREDGRELSERIAVAVRDEFRHRRRRRRGRRSEEH
ncbi:MAG: MerR family transcriptional regulator [Akkermansiaceae bacterium]